MYQYGDLRKIFFYNCENDLFLKRVEEFRKYFNKIYDDKFIRLETLGD